MIFLSCSINAKKKVVPVVEPEKTKLELAVETANEAELIYEDGDFTAAIEKFVQAIDYYNQALPSSVPTDSLPQQIFKLRMNVAKIHNDYAFSLSGQKEFDSAITEYEASLTAYQNLKNEAAPKDSVDYKIKNLYTNLAICSKEAGEYQKAIDYYDLYLNINPEDNDVLLQKFYIYKDNLKDENQAFEVLKAYAINKNDFNASHKLGDLYREKNDADNAILWYDKARSIKNDANVLQKLAALYRTKQQWENATLSLEQFILLKPDNDGLKTAYKLIGDNYKNLKNRAKSVEYFEKYLELEYNEDIALYVCLYYYDIKNNAKSMNMANLILSKNPNNTNAILFRAIARYNLKDMKGAKADFERIQNDPKQGKTAQQYLKIIK
jgi:tetratricopeptide (TPR) repeat protein